MHPGDATGSDAASQDGGVTDTIVALSSGALPAGIAVLRVSGPAARSVLAALAGGVPEPRHAALRAIRDAGGGLIDRGLVLIFPGPHSVTGEDLAEFHLHGGPAVVAAALAAMTALPGVRLAEAGEFTRRAFENGRIDLTEAEGLADLLAAETEGQRRQAVAQAGGSLRALYEGWMARLTRARALLEAELDFSDEGDVPDAASAGVARDIAAIAAEMTAHLRDARRGEILRGGYRVVIAGAPNAGKSSLLNALAERDVAIVSDSPGTTRDVLEVRLDLGGIPVRLSDTAGLREAGDAIEAIGIARARAAIAEADLVLHLIDCTAPETAPFGAVLGEGAAGDGPPVVTLWTKLDADPAFRAPAPVPPAEAALAVSSRTGAGMAALVELLGERANGAAGDPASVLPARLRHRQIVAGALEILDVGSIAGQPPEIAAETLRRASDRLGALTGRVGVEDLLDVIFSQFCIGK